MTAARDVGRGVVLILVLVGATTAATLGIIGAVVPATAVRDPSASAAASFDLTTPPTAIGGRLELAGDRTGILLLEAITGGPARFVEMGDGAFNVSPAADAIMSGDGGRVRFEHDSGAITLIEFDGWAFYLDPGECTVTLGATNADRGLTTGSVECASIADVRGKGSVSVTGFIVAPTAILVGRGDLPRSGGTLEVDGTAIELDEAIIFVGGEPDPGEDRIGWGLFSEDFESGIHLEYDPDSRRFYLGAVSVGPSTSGGPATAFAAEPCPIASETLGTIDELTRVVRLTFDCAGLDVQLQGEGEVGNGDTWSVTGTIVADVVGELADGA